MVLDASLAVDLLARRGADAAVADALRRGPVMVPAHFDGEVYAALRSLDRRGRLRAGQLDAIVPVLARFRAERVPLARLLAQAHALGTRFSPRDALYVALALRAHGELLTADRPLAETASPLVRVRLISLPAPAAP